MFPEQIAIFILLGSFIFLILAGVHIVFAIGIATIATSLYLGIPLMVVAQNMVKGINVFSLLAVPFFIIMGEFMGSGGISKRLIALANALVGWIRGGLAMVNIVASMFFGGISGSASADVASIGVILIPMMKEQGYDVEFSAGVTLASSVQGILIPPSHNMVIFALAAGGVSIAKLFLAGMVPGVFLGIALMVYSYVVSVKRKYPIVGRFNFWELVKVFFSSLPGLITVLIVVVGVVGGIFTATESSAIAVVYAFITTFFVLREIPLRDFPRILARCIKPLSITMMLIGTATSFGWMMAYLEVPSMLTNFILGISSNRIIILLVINLLLLFLGTIMNMVSIIVILTPILLPIAISIGMDVVHFGIMMILNLGIGLLTPPVGTVLFIGSAISGLKLEKLSKAMLPFYLVMIITLLIITFVPEIVMFFPNLFLPD